MLPFRYARAATVDQAIAAGAAPHTAFLAGGTELLNWLRLGVAAPARLVDITRLDGLARIEPLPDGRLRIGALAALSDVARHERVVRDYPVLHQAILQAASPQLRNLATIGGNPLQHTRCPYYRSAEPLPCNKRAPGSGCAARYGLNDRHAIFGWTDDCVATQPSDPAVAFAALDAVFATERAGGGRRIPATELHPLPAAPWPHHVLEPGELITAIELPPPVPRSAYVKVRERASYEYATVSAAVAIELDGATIRRARIALGSVAHRPWRLTATEQALAGLDTGNARALRRSLDASFAEARPLAHNGHKIPLAKAAAFRAIELALRTLP